MIAEEFLSFLKQSKFDFFAGVPCSFLKSLIDCVISDKSIQYVMAPNEGDAIAIATGAYLAGKSAVVLSQNSGLGNMINPLSSLAYIFKIPLLLLISLRGEKGLKDAPQHALDGEITCDLFNTLRIPYQTLPLEFVKAKKAVNEGLKIMKKTNLPYAFIVKKNTFEKNKKNQKTPKFKKNKGEIFLEEGEKFELSRYEAIKTILDFQQKDWVIIGSTGKISRELFTIKDQPGNFYMIGSMGCAASIGLGISLSKPNKKVIVLDGDGALIMRMGNLPTIGFYSPSNFIHILLDNESHDSTGGQFTVSPTTEFSKVALFCNYKRAAKVCSKRNLIYVLNNLKDESGPHFIHIKIKNGSVPDVSRPTLTPVQIKERFMKFLGN